MKFLVAKYGFEYVPLLEMEWFELQVWNYFDYCKREKEEFDYEVEKGKWRVPR